MAFEEHLGEEFLDKMISDEYGNKIANEFIERINANYMTLTRIDI